MTKTQTAITAALALVGITASTPVYADGKDGYDLSLSLDLGVSRTDNRDNVPNGGLTQGARRAAKTSNTEFRIAPVVQYEVQTSDSYDLRIYYRPVYVWYSNPREGGVKSQFSQGFDLRLGTQLSPRSRFVLTDNLHFSPDSKWNYNNDEYSYSPEDYESRKDEHYVNKLYAQLTREFTRLLRGEINGTYQIKRYDKKNLAEYYDEDLYIIGGSLQIVQNRHISYGVYSRYTIYDRSTHGTVDDRPGRVDNGVTYWNNGLQATYDLFGNKRFVFNGSIGYNQLWHEADNVDDESMWGDSTIDLTMFQQERTGGKIGYRLGKAHSDIFPYSSQRDNAFFGSVFHAFGKADRSLKIGTDFELRTRKFKLITIDDDADIDLWNAWLAENGYARTGKHDTTYLRLWAKYRITDNVDTSVFYSYEKVKSDVTNDYTANTVGASVTIRFF